MVLPSFWRWPETMHHLFQLPVDALWWCRGLMVVRLGCLWMLCRCRRPWCSKILLTQCTGKPWGLQRMVLMHKRHLHPYDLVISYANRAWPTVTSSPLFRMTHLEPMTMMFPFSSFVGWSSVIRCLQTLLDWRDFLFVWCCGSFLHKVLILNCWCLLLCCDVFVFCLLWCRGRAWQNEIRVVTWWTWCPWCAIDDVHQLPIVLPCFDLSVGACCFDDLASYPNECFLQTDKWECCCLTSIFKKMFHHCGWGSCWWKKRCVWWGMPWLGVACQQVNP